MAQASPIAFSTWTAADLVARFGAIPLHRVRLNPPPGEATEEDVLEIHDHEDRLFELIDGVLVEKTVGNYESYLAGVLTHLLWSFVEQHKLGIVLPADGMFRLAHKQVRIPDVAFIAWDRLPRGERIPKDPVAAGSPNLAVEVISPSNTAVEMQRKLHDYFAAGVQSVWYVYPKRREVLVYSSPDQHVTLGPGQTLHGEPVLPGFALELERLFAEPPGPAADERKAG
jgi:Uma2 family endonuclease